MVKFSFVVFLLVVVLFCSCARRRPTVLLGKKMNRPGYGLSMANLHARKKHSLTNSKAEFNLRMEKWDLNLSWTPLKVMGVT